MPLLSYQGELEKLSSVVAEISICSPSEYPNVWPRLIGQVERAVANLRILSSGGEERWSYRFYLCVALQHLFDLGRMREAWHVCQLIIRVTTRNLPRLQKDLQFPWSTGKAPSPFDNFFLMEIVASLAFRHRDYRLALDAAEILTMHRAFCCDGYSYAMLASLQLGRRDAAKRCYIRGLSRLTQLDELTKAGELEEQWRRACSDRREVDVNAVVTQVKRAAPPRMTENSCRKEGPDWIVTFCGNVIRLTKAKGMEYLAYLLSRPNQKMRAIHLCRVGAKSIQRADLPRGAAGMVDGSEIEDLPGRDLGPRLDKRACAEYAARLRDIEGELERAVRLADCAAENRLKLERETIREELKKAVRPDGRPIKEGSGIEKVRKAVSNAIRRCIDRIASKDPSLGKHLTRSIQTGTLCSYCPDKDLCWIVSLAPHE